MTVLSHPTGVRGLKCHGSTTPQNPRQVAPHWGAWIEITRPPASNSRLTVAPHWGAWIEISVFVPSCEPPSGRTPLGCVD